MTGVSLGSSAIQPSPFLRAHSISYVSGLQGTLLTGTESRWRA